MGLDGHLLAPGQAASAVLLAWANVLAPTLAFAAVGLLGSVAFGRSPLGLVLPVLLALLLQLAQQLPLPVVVRVALPSYAFIGWRGLFTDRAQIAPLLVGVAVSLVLAVAASALAYRLFMRRDFTNLAYDGDGRTLLMGAVLPLAALFAVTVAVIAGATSASASGSTSRNWTGPSRQRSPTCTACRPQICIVRPSPRRNCRRAPRVTRVVASLRMWDRATTGGVS